MIAARPIDVMIAGAQRAGTSTLGKLLSDLPGVATHRTLEFTYFVLPPDRRDSYETAFRNVFDTDAAAASLILAKSAGVMSLEAAQHLLAERNAQCRLIVTLRDPVERAHSAYWYLRRIGRADELTFEEALAAEAARRPGHDYDDYNKWYLQAYRPPGDYLPQLEGLFELFGRDRVRVVLFDQIRNDPDTLVTDIAGWLDLPLDTKNPGDVEVQKNAAAEARSPRLAGLIHHPPSLVRQIVRLLPAPLRQRLRKKAVAANETPFVTPAMDPGTRSELTSWFAPRNDLLASRLGLDLSAWSQPD